MEASSCSSAQIVLDDPSDATARDSSLSSALVPPENKNKNLELGYILLKDCRDVTLPVDTPHDEWIDVQVVFENLEDSSCCYPILAKKNGQLYVTLGDWKNNMHGCCAREITCQQCGLQRADIMVLLGLWSTHRSIVELQTLRLWTNGIHTHFLVTLSFPTVLEYRSLNVKTGLKKPLPSSLQTLLMMVESDWQALEKTLVGSMRKNPVSFFPKQLTIAELYQRLETTSERQPSTDSSRPFNHLLDLPSGVWSRTLGPCFNADDVENLRNSCQSLRYKLRDLVPGLRLQLYPHQVRSLEWMRQREQRALSENEILKQCSNLHRSITGGASVFLKSRDGSFSIRLNASTGEECPVPKDDSLMMRKVARGGMLCDDPGLGKTITVLALILQTCFKGENHCDSVREISPENQDEDDDMAHEIERTETPDDVIFFTYWAQEVTSEFRVHDYLKLFNGFCRLIPVMELPIQQVRGAIANNEYGSDFRCFDKAMRSLISTSVTRSPTTVGQCIDLWDKMVDSFKSSQMRSVRRYFSSLSSKPNSKVATLIDKAKKEKLLQSLFPSYSTLLVVPAVLLDHWQSQIEQHVNWGYCTDRIPLIFVFTPKTSETQLSKLTRRTNNKLKYSPMLFIDKAGTMKLPDAKTLAQFRLVITTTNRFKNEWKNGSFQREIQEKESTGAVHYRFLETTSRANSSCELLKVHWARMIVDEGHSMGNKTSSTIQFSSWIQASRRWVMTGTPTKHGGTELTQLYSLLRFLGHEFFTSRSDGDVYWKRHIAKEWKEDNLASFYRLSSLLGCLMKRHTKLDIDALKPPDYYTTKISMSSSEVATYNTLVSGVQSNIMLTSMDSKTSGLQDSLLSRNQVKNARQALSNIRRVCTGCTRVVPVLTDVAYQATLKMTESLGFSEEQRVKVKKYIHCVENEGQPECGVCSFRVPSQILMPCCAGIICTECMTNKTSSCLLCDRTFDPDELQRFQPGFDLHWKLNLIRKAQAKGELTHTATSDTGTGDTNIPLLPNEILIRPSEARPRTRVRGDGHTCLYDKYRVDGVCTLCMVAHDSCNLMNKESRCPVCHKTAEPCPEEESKSFYLVEKLLSLHKKHARHSRDNVTTGSPYQDVTDAFRPLKVIVFSQFRQTLNFVGDRLLRRFGAGCIGEYFGKHRSQELHKFRFDASCFCLLLTKDGAEGLDLSFVTNIIFLDEIYDKSLRDQAVARAWRMGAKGSVDVETLVAKNSVEETIGEIESSRKDATNAREKERIKKLLLSLKLNTDYHYFARSNDIENIDVLSVARTKRKHVTLSPIDLSVEPLSRKKRVRFALD